MAARDYHRDEFIFKTISALRIVVGVAVTLAVLFAMVWLIDYSGDRPASSYTQQSLLLSDQGEEKNARKPGTFFEGLLQKKAEQNEQAEHVVKNRTEGNASTPVPHRSVAVKKKQAQSAVTQPQQSQLKIRSAIQPQFAETVFAVQLGSFQDAERAGVFSEELAAKGYQPYIIKSSMPDSSMVYRVRIGRFATREEAMKLASTIEGNEKISVFVTSQ